MVELYERIEDFFTTFIQLGFNWVLIDCKNMDIQYVRRHYRLTTGIIDGYGGGDDIQGNFKNWVFLQGKGRIKTNRKGQRQRQRKRKRPWQRKGQRQRKRNFVERFQNFVYIKLFYHVIGTAMSPNSNFSLVNCFLDK